MRGFDGIWPPVCVQGQGKGDDLERSRSVWKRLWLHGEGWEISNLYLTCDG